MWDLREPVTIDDGSHTYRRVVRAGVRRIVVPYLRRGDAWDPIVFVDVLFERDPMPGPIGYAAYRRVA